MSERKTIDVHFNGAVYVVDKVKAALSTEMCNLLERLTNPNNCKKDIVHLLGEADNLLVKARGE